LCFVRDLVLGIWNLEPHVVAAIASIAESVCQAAPLVRFLLPFCP